MADESSESDFTKAIPLEARLTDAFSDSGSKPCLLDDALVAELLSVLQSDDEDSKLHILEVLANACRQASWRSLLSKSDLLVVCCRGFHLQEPADMLKQRLRFVGNCCADNDSNRKIVLESGFYEALAQVIADPSLSQLQPITMAVLFNFLNDYDPAQRHARDHGLVQTLIAAFRQIPGRPDFVTEYGPRCLELVINLESESDAEVPGDVVSILLNLATDLSTTFETFQGLLNCLNILLQRDSTKSYLLNAMLVSECLTLMLRLRHWEDTIVTDTDLTDTDEEREVALKSIRDCRSSLVLAIADTSAFESFLEHYPIGSDFMSLILRWLASQDLDLSACAALVLGNMARSPGSCEALITKHDAHLLLIRVIQEQSQVSILHAAGGALKNLAVGCPGLREQIVAGGFLEHFWKYSLAKAAPQVQLLGLSLVRVLVANSLSSVERLVDPARPISDSTLHSILNLYNSNTEQPIRTEIGRIIVSVLRETARCTAGSLEKVNLESRIFDLCPGFLEPVFQMVIQDRWPVVASEGWFALALFTRSTKGADVFAGLPLPKEFYQALKQVAGRDLHDIHHDEQALGGQSQDSSSDSGLARERCQKNKVNVYIFLSEFLKNADSIHNESQRSLFQRLLDGEEVTDVHISRALDFETGLASLSV